MAVEPTITSPGDEPDNQAPENERDGATPRKRMSDTKRAALHAGIGLAGSAAKHSGQKHLSNEEIEELEDAGHKAVDNDFYRDELGALRQNLKDPSWYKKAAVGSAKAGLGAATGKLKKSLIATAVISLVAVVLLFLLGSLGPWKHIHFETILRSVHYARFQVLIHQFSSKVVFQAAVLTPDSQGSFRKSPLVKQILLATPDRQIKQLGRSGKIQWDFYENRSFGQSVLPLSESLRGVTIEGEKFYISDVAQELYGQDYKQLGRAQRWRVEQIFVERVKNKLGPLQALMPRHVRWNPMYQMRQRVGMHLVKWLDSAKQYRGQSVDDARAMNIDDTIDRVMGPEESLPHSSNGDIDESAKEKRQAWIESVRSGEPRTGAGEVASRLGTRMKTIGAISDITFAMTATCIVHDLANSFNDYQDEREAMAMRSSGNEQSTTDQFKSGGRVVAEAEGAAAGQWNAFGDVTDASSSYLYRQLTNQRPPPQSEIQRQSVQIPYLKPVSFFAQAIVVSDQILNTGLLSLIAPDLNKAFVDKGCEAMLSAPVQYGTTAVELFLTVVSLGSVKGFTAAAKATVTLGMHAALGYGISQLLDDLIVKAEAEYTALAFSGTLRGSDRWNADYVAYDSTAQASNRMIYGRPNTDSEAGIAIGMAMNELRDENRSKPAGERYFAIDNPFSLAGMVVGRMPAGAQGFANTIHSSVSFLGSILSSPFQLFGSMSNSGLLGTASAADTTFLNDHFGVDEWGWSAAELQRIETDDSFSLEPLVNRVEPRLEELDQRFGKCYDFSTFVLQSEAPKEGCTRADLSTDDALYWRYYKALMFSATIMTGDV